MEWRTRQVTFENVGDNPGKEDIYEKEDQKISVTSYIIFYINGTDACSGSGSKSDSNYSQNENLLQKRQEVYDCTGTGPQEQISLEIYDKELSCYRT